MSSALQRTLRRAAWWAVPRGAQALARHALESLRERPGDSPPRAEIRANRKFKGIHAGKRAFILATGPSIRTQDLRGLEGEICFGVGQFYLHDDIARIRPRYHVESPLHEPFGPEDVARFFEGYRAGYSKETTFFFGHRPYRGSFHAYLRAHPEQRPEHCHWLDYRHYTEFNEHTYDHPSRWDICGNPFQPRTVVYSAIQVAHYMGCSEIYLLGCDHDYLADTKRVQNHHFYKEEKGISDVKLLSTFDSERWFGEYHDRWRDYRLIRDYLAPRGCRVYNSTQGGMLDVFPRVPLEMVLGKAAPAI